MIKIKNYINGELCDSANHKFIDNYDPARGKVYGLIPDSNEEDINHAVSAAKAAFIEWKKTSFEKRASYLRKMAELILLKQEELAQIESRDNGKPLSLARSVDIPRSATNFQFFADAITQFHGESYKTVGENGSDILNFTEYSPLGVVACISPWNLPLYLFTWKIAPALAAGNTVVAKPSEVTPMTAYYLAQIAIEAGLPKGVLNIVHGKGPEVGTPLITHPDIKAVSFTGSTATGKYIAKACAETFKKVSLEMGGKNPNIIFADANLEKAIATTMRSSFANQGQICLCGSRIFVERPVYEQVKNALIEKASKIKIGDPINPETQHGALVSKPHFDKVLSYIELAKKDGATILTGGEKISPSKDLENGYFLAPTLIEGLDSNHPVNQEEIFGPVASLIPFDTIEEVIEMANSTKYGLSASVWTQDISKAQHVAKELDSGIVWINSWMVRDLRTPFGGVKDSGYGREGGFHALKFFSEVKNTCLNF